ncbi:MAG: cation:proton antiporter [Patescibacteria group bacterium]
MYDDAFIQLSVVIVLAAGIAAVMRLLRQPLIIGHIITGIIVGPSLLSLLDDKSLFQVYSDTGIALLLFIIGLELNAAVIRRLGRVVILTAMVLLTTIGSVGFLVASAFDFNRTEAIILGLALFFSSTIIIAKVLSDKRELTRQYGQIAIGIILIDDIIATFALLFLVAGSEHSLSAGEIGTLALKGVGLAAVFTLIGAQVLPRIGKFMAGSQELLFLFAIAWGFGVATLISQAGFSIEIGALFAGVMLAHLPYAAEMGARLKPLRDFFIVLFFVVLGEGLVLTNLSTVLIPALAFAAIVTILKPIIVMSSLGMMRYTKRTSFKAAINLSQISEFSIVLVVLAVSTGAARQEVATVITLVALITIAISTYLMQYDNWLYGKLEKLLQVFERRTTREREYKAKAYPLILFGYKKGGHEFVKTFKSMKKSFVVVDYSPDVIEFLTRQQIECLYGDATDNELLAELHMAKAKLVVSTITDYPTNVSLLRYVIHHNKNVTFICHANDYNEAADLYEHGAAYVMLPHFIGSERMSLFIHRNGLDKEMFAEHRKKHLVAIGQAAVDHTP